MMRVFLIAFLAAALQAQPIPPRPAAAVDPAETPKGRITGTVVSSKTGEILRSAHVVLRGGTPDPRRGRAMVSRDAVTGVDGRFSFADLPAGDYTLFGIKAGYGSLSRRNPEFRVALGSDEAREGLVLRLQPSGVVSGRVFDSYGEPLEGAEVYALTRSYREGRVRWGLMDSARTNDLGEYRLFGLSAGRYVIGSAPPPAPSPRGVSYREFAPNFFPSADSPEQATVLKVSWGSELTGIDFRLRPAPKTRLQGVVIAGATGEPCACSVSLHNEDGLDSARVTATREGIFVMHGVGPGLRWLVGRQNGPSRDLGAERVMIPPADPVEVRLVIGAGQTVSGEVVLEGPPKEANPVSQQGDHGRPRRMQPFFLSLEGDGPHGWGQSTRSAAPAQGGPFEFNGITAGTFKVRVQAPGGYLRAISLGGQVLPTPEITVQPDTPLSGLKLHVAFDGATVSGTVKFASERAAAEAVGNGSVVVVPEPDSNPYAVRAFFGVGPDGVLRGQPLAPGRYTLYAVSRPDAFDLEDPELRRMLEPFAKRLTLSKGEKATVEMTFVDESLAPGP